MVVEMIAIYFWFTYYTFNSFDWSFYPHRKGTIWVWIVSGSWVLPAWMFDRRWLIILVRMRNSIIGGLGIEIIRHWLPCWRHLMYDRLAYQIWHVGSGKISMLRGHHWLIGIDEWYFRCFWESWRRGRNAKINSSIIEVDVNFEVKSIIVPLGKPLIWIVVIVKR